MAAERKIKTHPHRIVPRSRVGRKLWLVIRGVPPRGRYTKLRRLLQLTILSLFAFQLVYTGRIIIGSLASSRILDTIPMMDAWAWTEQAVATHSPTLESVTAVLVVATLYLVVLGRFFCGWVCPMDLLFSLFERKLSTAKAGRLSRPHTPGRLEKLAPLAAMAVYLALSVALGQPFFTSVSPVKSTTELAETLVGVVYNIPGASLALAMGWLDIVAFALIANIIAEYVFGVKRFWCRFICPIGNLYGFLGNRHSLLTVRVRQPEHCLGCNICSLSCPMSIDLLPYIREGRPVDDYRCFRCGRCAEVCPHHVLELGFRFTPSSGEERKRG